MSDRDLQGLARAAATGGEEDLRRYAAALKHAGQEREELSALVRGTPRAPDLRARVRALAARVDPWAPERADLAWARRVQGGPLPNCPFTPTADPLTLLLHPNYHAAERIENLGAPVLDVATGATRWTLDEPGALVGDLIVAHQEPELVGLDLDSGAERWRLALPIPSPDLDPEPFTIGRPVVDLIDLGDRRALAVRQAGAWLLDLDAPAAVRTLGRPGEPGICEVVRGDSELVVLDRARGRVRGEDPRTGATRYEHNVEAVGLAASSSLGPILHLPTGYGLGCLDPATGDWRWELQGVWRGASREHALLLRGQRHLAAFDLRDGREVARYPNSTRSLANPTPNGLNAWVDAEGWAAVCDVASGEPLWRAPLPDVVREGEWVALALLPGALVGTSHPVADEPAEDMGSAFCWRFA